MAPRLKYKNSIVSVAIFLSAIFFIAPKIVGAEIIINEIMYDASGADDKHEWVEIYNSGGASVDLTDWKINDGDTATNHALNAPPKNNSRGSIILPANAYLLLADDAATIANDLPNYSGTIIDTVLSLSNTSATLKLLNKDGVEASTAIYNKDMGGINGKTLEWNGATMKESLSDGGTPGRVNSALSSPGTTPGAAPSASFTPTSSATASATPEPGYQYSQQIFINEFLPWPESGAKEWIEIINLDGAIINLSGWQIDDGNASTSPQTLPAGTSITPGEFLVITFNKSVLNNDGDKIRLLWPDDQVVHVVSYAKTTLGQAVAKFDAGWLWTNQPTPGQANKKSFLGTVEAVSSVPVNNARITTLEDAVAPATSAPSPAARVANKTASVQLTPPAVSNGLRAGLGAPEPNLLAAASEPVGMVKNNNYLVLAGVIFLAALAAIGLIYFRRQKQVDIGKMDD